VLSVIMKGMAGECWGCDSDAEYVTVLNERFDSSPLHIYYGEEPL